MTRPSLLKATLSAVMWGALILGVIGVCSLGCEGWNGPVGNRSTQDRIGSLSYGKDHRTGLCFAVLYWNGETRSASLVPCSAEVLMLAGERNPPATPDGGPR